MPYLSRAAIQAIQTWFTKSKWDIWICIAYIASDFAPLVRLPVWITLDVRLRCKTLLTYLWLKGRFCPLILAAHFEWVANAAGISRLPPPPPTPAVVSWWCDRWWRRCCSCSTSGWRRFEWCLSIVSGRPYVTPIKMLLVISTTIVGPIPFNFRSDFCLR